MWKILKEKIKRFIYNLPMKRFLKNIILLESNPDYSDNTYYVFKELLNQKINENCKLVWFVKDEKMFEDIKIKNVEFIGNQTSFFKSFKLKYYHLFAKCIVDCNKYIKKMNKEQYRIYLTHGSPAKMAPNYWFKSGKIDSFVVTSEFWKNVTRNIYGDSDLIENYLISGLPRNDNFLKNEKLKVFFEEIEREKTILWLPTYRQHKDVSDKDFQVDANFEFGIPCFANTEEARKVDEVLKEKNVLLILKPHPAQDLSKIKDLGCTNIKIINDSYFEEHSNLYEYLPLVDALITDYSSVYFDFLLADKPIGLAIPDLETYTKTFEMPYDYNQTVIGEKILTNEDLIKFIFNVANNDDIMKQERNKVKIIYHKNVDDKAAYRVVELLKEKIGSDK